MGRDFFKELFKAKNWNRSSLLVFAGALGLFFLLAGNAFSPGNRNHEADAAQSTASDTVYAQEYAASLEQTLTRVIESIQGAGQVKVAVTLEAGPQTVYALDEQIGEKTGARPSTFCWRIPPGRTLWKWSGNRRFAESPWYVRARRTSRCRHRSPKRFRCLPVYRATGSALQK